MKAEIVSVGTELLLGTITDTNASFLAGELAPLGIDLYYVSQVGDNLERITGVLSRAWKRSDLTIVTGGIGPTDDDMTREAIAAMLGEVPAVDATLVAQVERFFKSRGIPMPEKNYKQAWLIPSAQALPNPLGTAPGWFVDRDGRMIVSMPGVPREMTRMWREEAVPRVQRYLPPTVIVSRTLKTLGIGESSAEEALGALVNADNPTTATYAKDDGVHVRITAKAPTAQEARAAIAPVEAEARERLGDTIYGVDADTLPGSLLGLLGRNGYTLATCDVNTGARLAALFGDDPAAPSHYAGGWVIDLAAARRLCAGDGGEMTDLAGRLAARLRTEFNAGAGMVVLADIGASAEAGTGRYPAQLVCALDLSGRAHTRVDRFTSTRADLRRRAVLWGLEFLRKELLRAGQVPSRDPDSRS